MAIYTVHAPPEGALDEATAGRIRFIRDGFSVWALVLPGVWLLWNRLWLAFLGWLAVMVGFELMGRAFGDTVVLIAATLFGVFLALEARDLQRWTLERRGWRLLGVVEGSDLEVAERRFFETWATPTPAGDPDGGSGNPGAEDEDEPADDGDAATAAVPAARPTAPRATPVPHVPRPHATGVIGLFPESGGRR